MLEYSHLARWIGLVETNMLLYTFLFSAKCFQVINAEILKNGKFLHVHLQSTIKHLFVTIIYIQGALLFFLII